ncbi:MAG: twin-arginine translocase TatA/TatE family subunit [Alphaproteobacteria bacterium]
MAPSFWQILIVLVLIVLLFGRGKISDLMGDVAKGIKSFRKGLKEDEEPAQQERPTIDNASGRQADDTTAAPHKQETRG